jgi:hypothetical protein
MSGGRRQQLEAAYRATLYAVETPGGRFTLRVGQYSAPLALLYRQHGVQEAVYLTASNSGSRQQPEAANRAANAVLWQQLQATGRPCFRGHAIDPEGLWPGESSFLALGLDLAAATALGRGHGQCALLVAGSGAIPELCWLTEPER